MVSEQFSTKRCHPLCVCLVYVCDCLIFLDLTKLLFSLEDYMTTSLLVVLIEDGSDVNNNNRSFFLYQQDRKQGTKTETERSR